MVLHFVWKITLLISCGRSVTSGVYCLLISRIDSTWINGHYNYSNIRHLTSLATILYDRCWVQKSEIIPKYYQLILLVLEWTVRCSWTVQFFVMFDMFEVRFWAKMWCSEVFEVRTSCYVTRLVLEHIVWCSRTVRFFVMFEVQFWAKIWCSESSMFEVFKVWYFGVHPSVFQE